VSESPPKSFVEPVRILSDLHLAHPASTIGRVSSLRPLLEGAGTVIFNGDTCEQCYHAWRDAGAEKLEELQALCAEVGATPIFLAGNHDPGISSAGWLELAGGALLITHGHAIFPTVAPWSHEYLRKKVAIRKVERERRADGAALRHRWETTRLITKLLMPDRPRRLGRKGRNYLLSAVWPPDRCFHILRIWLTMVGAADRFVARYRPGTQVFLFGHFHRAGVWKRSGRILCNTGAFMRGSTPLLAELREQRLAIFPVRHRGGSFRMGPLRSQIPRPLSNPPPSPPSCE
jgi:predicted phosphodiesterase